MRSLPLAIVFLLGALVACVRYAEVGERCGGWGEECEPGLVCSDKKSWTCQPPPSPSSSD